MNDADLMALNVLMEAGGEITAGQAAIVRVVQNRMAKKFFSDGTVAGTVLAKDQFSWAWFDFRDVVVSGTISVPKHIDHKYVRVCSTLAEAAARADNLFFAKQTSATMARCAGTAGQMMAKVYYDARVDQLGEDAVSYLNPRILTKLPSWAIPSKLIVSIGRHDFYRA